MSSALPALSRSSSLLNILATPNNSFVQAGTTLVENKQPTLTSKSKAKSRFNPARETDGDNDAVNLRKAARKHGAAEDQFKLAQCYRYGSNGLKKNKKRERYWLERAVASDSEHANASARLQEMKKKRKRINLLFLAVGLSTATAGPALIGAGAAALGPVGIGVGAGVLAAGAAALWKLTKQMYDAAGVTQRAKEDIKVEETKMRLGADTEDTKVILKALTTTSASIDTSVADKLIDELYAVEECRPILDVAAWLVRERGLKIELLDDKDQKKEPNSTTVSGGYNRGTKRVWAHCNLSNLHDVRSTIMHELTHAVAHAVFNNNVKTYRTPEEKLALKRAIKASARNEGIGGTRLDRYIETTLNRFFHGGDDHKKAYKRERQPRIAELLVYDPNAKKTFQERYEEELAYFEYFTGLCTAFLDKQVWKPEQNHANDVPNTFSTVYPGHQTFNSRLSNNSVARGIINRTVRLAFENTHGNGHESKTNDAVNELAAILKSNMKEPGKYSRLTSDEVTVFDAELSRFYYETCYLQADSPPRRDFLSRRQYLFDRMDSEALKTKVADLIEAILSNRPPATQVTPVAADDSEDADQPREDASAASQKLIDFGEPHDNADEENSALSDAGDDRPGVESQI